MELKKINRSTKKKIVLILIGVILVIIDQFAKFFLVGKNFTLIANTLNIDYYQNEGLAFSLFDGDLLVIMAITAVILGFLVKLIINYFNENKFVYATSLIFIVSGGFSNLIDRILKGYVVDYLNVTLFNFPIFNLADILITVGIIILFVLVLRDLIVPERKRKEKKEKKLKKKRETEKIRIAKLEEKLDNKIEEVVKEEEEKEKAKNAEKN